MLHIQFEIVRFSYWIPTRIRFVDEKTIYILSSSTFIPFNGQIALKQYIYIKAIYRSVVYQGWNTISSDLQETYFTRNGLLKYLANRIADNSRHKIFCNNYFTSLLLLDTMLDRGMLWTIQNNRFKYPLKTEAELKTMDRGSSDAVTIANG